MLYTNYNPSLFRLHISVYVKYSGYLEIKYLYIYFVLYNILYIGKKLFLFCVLLA